MFVIDLFDFSADLKVPCCSVELPKHFQHCVDVSFFFFLFRHKIKENNAK